MSLPTVDNWRNRAGFPGGVKGPWVQSTVEAWCRANGLGDDDPGDDSGDDGDGLSKQTMRRLGAIVATAKAAEAREKARNLKLKNDALEGKTLDRDEARVEVTEMLSLIRDRLIQMPNAAAIEVPAEVQPKVIAALKRFVAGMMNEIRVKGEAMFE